MPPRLRTAVLCTFALLALGAGCSVIVPGDLPSYKCTVGDPASCPTGLACDPTSLGCVASSEVPDADEDTQPDDTRDASPDGPTPLSPLGGACVADDDCQSGLLCGSSSVLTTAIVPANTESICTKPCCTTADCAAGFVCFSGGTGGNYCVAADKADRTPPATGGKGPGQSCSTATDCRSGLCAGRCTDAPEVTCTTSKDCPSGSCATSGRRCIDTCCTTTECGGGSSCRILNVANHVIWSCGTTTTGATKDLNQTCNENSDCKNDNCTGFPAKRCTPPCCRSSECTALGFTNNVCTYGVAGNDSPKWCVEQSGTGAAVGTNCNDKLQCASQYCDAEFHKCMNVCCTDDDCASNEHCRPSPVGNAFLRCVKDS